MTTSRDYSMIWTIPTLGVCSVVGMAAQCNQVDVIANTDGKPIGPGRAQNRRTDLLLRPTN